MRLRSGAALLGCVLALTLPAAAAETSLSIGEKYSRFEDSKSREQGSQFFTPIALSAGTDNGFFGGLSTGYVVSTYRPPQSGAEDVTVSTLLDTKVSLFYTMALARTCIRMGSTFNLPTGLSALTAEESLAEMDRQYGELVDVPNFGEGTNANPGFAVTLPLDNVTVGFGVSYHLRGAYDPTADIANDILDPGDEALTKFSIRWKGEDAKVFAGVKYQVIGADEVNGLPVYKEGDMVSANVKVEYTPRPVLVFLEGAFNTWGKSKSLSGAGNLPLEEFGRYGDEVLMRAQVQYIATPKLVLLVEADGHWVQQNDFPRYSPNYDSGRTSVSGIVGLVYQVVPGLFLHGSAGYQQVEEEPDAESSVGASYSGLKASLHLVTLFK